MNILYTLRNALTYQYARLNDRDRSSLTTCCIMAILFAAADPFSKSWLATMCVAGIIISGAFISPDIVMLGIAAMVKADMTDAGGEAWFWENWQNVLTGYIYYKLLLAMAIRCGCDEKPYREKKPWFDKIQWFCMIPAKITLCLGALWWGEPLVTYLLS